MNILHISPYFPSLQANHAGGVCMGKEIETLKEQGHTVFVLSFISQPFDQKLYENHQGDPHYQAVRISRLTRAWHILTEPWMPYYFAARSSLRFACKLIYTVKQYRIDAIHAEYAAMGQYLWIRRLFPHLKFVLVEHDMTAQSFERKCAGSHGLKRKFMRGQLKRILRKEGKYIRQADRVLTFNEKDRKLIEDKYGRKDVDVLNPYFGDLGNLGEQVQIHDKESSGQETLRANGTICFLGQMGRPENHQAAMRLIHIFEDVRKKISGADLRLYIVGNGPSEELKKQENDFVHITGFVEDVDVYLRKAQLAVFPLEQGAGIKVKVLRAMAAATPVITGDIGAEGIDEDYEVLIHAESDEEYVNQIIACLSGEIDTEACGRKVFEYVREHFDWARSEEVLKKLY